MVGDRVSLRGYDARGNEEDSCMNTMAANLYYYDGELCILLCTKM